MNRMICGLVGALAVMAAAPGVAQEPLGIPEGTRAPALYGTYTDTPEASTIGLEFIQAAPPIGTLQIAFDYSPRTDGSVARKTYRVGTGLHLPRLPGFVALTGSFEYQWFGSSGADPIRIPVGIAVGRSFTLAGARIHPFMNPEVSRNWWGAHSDTSIGLRAGLEVQAKITGPVVVRLGTKNIDLQYWKPDWRLQVGWRFSEKPGR